MRSPDFVECQTVILLSAGQIFNLQDLDAPVPEQGFVADTVSTCGAIAAAFGTYALALQITGGGNVDIWVATTEQRRCGRPIRSGGRVRGRCMPIPFEDVLRHAAILNATVQIPHPGRCSP